MVTKFKRFKKGESHQSIFFSTFLGILVLIVIGFLVASNWKISQKRTELTTGIETLEKEIQILEERKQELEAGISQAGTEDYLEKEFREKLGLKKPGEEVVVVKPPPEGYNLPTAHPEESAWQKLENFWQKILEKLEF